MTFEDQNRRNLPINTVVIKKELKHYDKTIKVKLQLKTRFVYSKHWFERFQKRANFHNIKMIGEIIIAKIEITTDYIEQLKKKIAEGDIYLHMYAKLMRLHFSGSGYLLEFLFHEKKNKRQNLKLSKLYWCFFLEKIPLVVRN